MASPARTSRGQTQHGPGHHGRATVDGGRQAEVHGRPQETVRPRETEGRCRDQEEAMVRKLRQRSDLLLLLEYVLLRLPVSGMFVD